MFSKASKATGRRPIPSIVGADCTFSGDIVSQGDVHIDGRVDGDVRCNMLVIGEAGTVTGEISAETVTVLGTVTGQITSKLVSLAKSARILGDITHDSLSVEVGAYVEGRFNRLPPAHPADAGALPIRNASGQALLSSTKAGEPAAASASEPPPVKVALVGN